ncbi:MAG TPA: 2'-5' RNA ligase family protein [Candidatus Saccharimonadales bacterium]|nr:2'-5' RNA ligase family protein [Candidatus Saccharimonadales bacterium]
MLPGDRLLCVFLDERPAGDSFTDWPLHITIVPWFRTAVPTNELTAHMKERLNSVTPFTFIVGGEAGFGFKGRKLVNLVEQPSPLDTIERQTRNLLHEHEAWLVDETTKKRRSFRPHVTVQKSGRVHEGDTFLCNALYIVEQKGGGHKEISARIEL